MYIIKPLEWQRSIVWKAHLWPTILHVQSQAEDLKIRMSYDKKYNRQKNVISPMAITIATDQATLISSLFNLWKKYSKAHIFWTQLTM